MKKVLLTLLMVLLALSATACFDIRVHECRSFPQAKFAAAWQRIEQIGRFGRGRPHELRLLAYDGDDHELVELGIPFWMVKKFSNHDRLSWGHPRGDRLLRRIDRPELRLEELRRRGPGLVARIDDDEDDAHILIWLE